MLPVRHLQRDHLREQGLCQARQQGMLHMHCRLRAPSLLTRELGTRQVLQDSMQQLKESYLDLVTHQRRLEVARQRTRRALGSPHHGLGRRHRTQGTGKTKGLRGPHHMRPRRLGHRPRLDLHAHTSSLYRVQCKEMEDHRRACNTPMSQRQGPLHRLQDRKVEWQGGLCSCQGRCHKDGLIKGPSLTRLGQRSLDGPQE